MIAASNCVQGMMNNGTKECIILVNSVLTTTFAQKYYTTSST